MSEIFKTIENELYSNVNKDGIDIKRDESNFNSVDVSDSTNKLKMLVNKLKSLSESELLLNEVTEFIINCVVDIEKLIKQDNIRSELNKPSANDEVLKLFKVYNDNKLYDKVKQTLEDMRILCPEFKKVTRIKIEHIFIDEVDVDFEPSIDIEMLDESDYKDKLLITEKYSSMD